MNICLISSEVYPYAKTGGLADVTGAMPKYLAVQGNNVRAITPWYKKTKEKFKGMSGFCSNDRFILQKKDRAEFMFIKNDWYFYRNGLYSDECLKKDYPDNLERFSFFCDQSLQLLKETNFRPDIINIHDWQSALVAVLIKTKYKYDPFFEKTKVVLTINNLRFQGIFGPEQLPILENIGINSNIFNPAILEFNGCINLLKAAIVFSDWVNTVSPNYAHEVLTEKFGEGLEGVLASKGGAFCGILNGIDNDAWNPMTDPDVWVNYNSKILKKKKENKIALQKKVGLKVNPNNLLTFLVGRIDRQKGVDTVIQCVNQLPKEIQLVILGTGSKEEEESLKKLSDKKNGRFVARIEYNENLARGFFAAGDIFINPARFEPCGLTQFYAYRYGALPIVSFVGGPADTVKDFKDGGCGFVMKSNDVDGLMKEIKNAKNIFFNNRELWDKKVAEAMALNHDWGKSIKTYLSVFQYLKTGIFPVSL